MKHRSRYLFFLLFWLIPALACNGGSSALATATAIATATAKPKATATTRPSPEATTTTAARPKATATRSSAVKATATSDSGTTTTGQFAPITFSVGVLNDVTAIDPLDTFPDGVTLIYAVFDYSGMQDGQDWRTEWKLDGEVQTDLGHTSQWKGGESGSWWVSISNPQGIRTGDWELALYLGDTLQQSGKVTVQANPAGQPDFGPITFATGKDAKDQPLNALPINKPVLPAGTTTVYAFFDGIDVPQGTTWTSHWFHNGESAADPKDHSWNLGPTENDWINFGTTDNTPLASGTYELQLSIGSNLVNVATYIMP